MDDFRTFVEDHLPLVQQVLFQVASRFPRHADREDLAQAGTLGLVEAARRYDPDRGVPFECWAARRIRGAILDAVRSIDFAPRSLRAAAREVEQARGELTAALSRTPDRAEVAERLGMAPAELSRIEDKVHRALVLSLDAPAGSDGMDSAATLADTISVVGDEDPADLVERREQGAYLAAAVDLLPERMRAVVAGYFLEGRSSAELAAELGITESRVSQLRTEGLAMLRAGLEAQYGERPHTATSKRIAARQAAYAASIATASTYRARVAASVPQQRRPEPLRAAR